jgi:hypothetical protein
LFEYLLQKYRVFDRFWDFVAPFGVKSRESDIGHAPFRFHQSESVVLDLQASEAKLGSFGILQTPKYSIAEAKVP